MATQRTCAIYARFSSDLQRDVSIDDQLTLCKKFASRESLNPIATFADRAKSAATLFDRPGLIDLMAAAKRKEFDAIVVESLDRLSRDSADSHGLFKRLKFYGVELVAVNEGKVTPMHVAIRGLVGQMFLTDLADKVRRHHTGRVLEGKFPGRVTYGYRAIAGKPGEREIEPAEAQVVIRIFREYVVGVSPRAIAAGLRRDGVPPPKGGSEWHAQCFTGGKVRRGILANPTYIGKITWNNFRTVRDPDTGRTVKREAPAHEHLTVDVPHLRIVDDALWQAAQDLRIARGARNFGSSKVAVRLPARASRSPHLLAGVLKCGACGNPMRIMMTRRADTDHGGDMTRVACSAAVRHDRCEHRKSYDLDKLQSELLKCFKARLTDPDAIGRAMSEFHKEWAAETRKARAEQSTVRKRLADIEAATMRMVDALEAGNMPADVITSRLQKLEAERVGLKERARLIDAESSVIDLHPGALKAYKANVASLHRALTADPTAGAEVTISQREAFRNLVDCVVVHPTARRAPYEFTPYGRLGALLGVDLFPAARQASEIIEGDRRPYFAAGGLENTNPASAKQENRVVSLGRWREQKAA